MNVKTLKVGIVAFSLMASSVAIGADGPKRVECIAPAGAGGGLDFVCRSIGKALTDQKLVNGNVKVTNMPGGGHGVGFAHMVSKRQGDAGTFVSCSTGTTSRLAQGAYPGMDASMVKWAATMGAEPAVIAVKKDSPYKTINDLLDAMKKDSKSVTFAGGSPAGGYDNLTILITAKRAGLTELKTIPYLSFNNGGDAVVQVVGGHVDAFLGDVSEALGFFESGDVRILALLAEERMGGVMADVPTAVEQGIKDAVWVNFRGVYVAPGISDEQYDWWLKTFDALYNSPEWEKIMGQKGLVPFHKTGDDFVAFVNQQIKDVADISQELGITKK